MQHAVEEGSKPIWTVFRPVINTNTLRSESEMLLKTVPTAQKTVPTLKDRQSVTFVETITAYWRNTRKQRVKPFGKTQSYFNTKAGGTRSYHCA